jgi:ferredoxin
VKVVLVYISPNKTTQKISVELSRCFEKDGHDVVEFNIGKSGYHDYGKIDMDVFKDADLLGIGFPVYHMSVFEPMWEFMKLILPGISERSCRIKAFIYMTYAGITSGKALLNMARLLKMNGLALAGALKIKAPHFWHIESYPDENAREMIGRFYDSMRDEGYEAIQWSRVKALLSYQKLRVKLLNPFAPAISKRRAQPISIFNDKCIKCKKCVNECPVNAIRMNGYPERTPDKCVYCYHCVSICPRNAVGCDIGKVKEIVEFNKKVVGLEQPQDEIFI